MKPLKMVAIGIGGLIGVAHIGLIGYVLKPQAPVQQPPTFNFPRGPYSSYKIKAGKDGYEIEYRANDPAILESTKSLTCLLYTSPSPRDKRQSRMPSSA